jgi:hypothetical protein
LFLHPFASRHNFELDALLVKHIERLLALRKADDQGAAGGNVDYGTYVFKIQQIVDIDCIKDRPNNTTFKFVAPFVF